MKKIICFILVLIVCIPLCACGTGIEGGEWEASIGVGYNYSASFSGGTLRLSTPEGIQNYSYVLEGDNTIVINDTVTYTYTISDNRLEFNKRLMGTLSTWYK